MGRPLGEVLDEMDRCGVGFALLAGSTLTEGDGSRPPSPHGQRHGTQGVGRASAADRVALPKRIVLPGKVPVRQKRNVEKTPQKGLF